MRHALLREGFICSDVYGLKDVHVALVRAVLVTDYVHVQKLSGDSARRGDQLKSPCPFLPVSNAPRVQIIFKLGRRVRRCFQALIRLGKAVP